MTQTDEVVRQCPDMHVEALRAHLPKVDRILTVGWRGREPTFLDMCGELINVADVATTVVDADVQGAKDVAIHLRDSITDRLQILPSTEEGVSAFLASPGAVEAAYFGSRPGALNEP